MDQSKLKDFCLTFLTPYYEQGRGNATTAKRIVEGLKESGIQAAVIAYDERPISKEDISTLQSSSLIHVLHFRRFAEWQEKNQFQFSCPYVITSGGTDVNIDIFKAAHKEKIDHVLTNARAITVFSNDAKEKIASVYPKLEGNVHIVKQSVWLPDQENRLAQQMSSGFPRILLPAGLREVKDVLFVLPALIKLKEKFPSLTFTILGAELEPDVVRKVKNAQKSYSWISYYPEVSLEEMTSVYRQFDMIINSSVSEGQSSALLEAMSLGIPVVARANGGNKSIVVDGETGFLFQNVEEFYEEVITLLSNNSLQKQLIEKAKGYVETNHSLKEEINSFLKLYGKIFLD